MKALKNFTLLFALLLTCTVSLKAQVSNQLEMLDIFNLEYISDPQISPDGQKIIYVRNFKDIMTDKNLSNLWTANFDGSQNRPLTTGEQNDRSPRWSHDGQKIVYSNKDEAGESLWIVNVASGENTRLTEGQDGGDSAPTWSPDGERIAFYSAPTGGLPNVFTIRPDGSESISGEIFGAIDDGATLGRTLAKQLREQAPADFFDWQPVDDR